VLSQDQRSVLTGTLLGDGSLPVHGRYPRLFIKHKAEHEPLALFKYEVFREFISMAPHRFDQRLGGRLYPCVQFVTRTRPEFRPWRERFYRERRKIVPVDIDRDLTPMALAVWIMDDGAADYAGLTIQTHGFTASEIRRLAAALRSRYRLRVGVRANRGHEVIYVFAEASRDYATSCHLICSRISRTSLYPVEPEPRRDYTLAPSASSGDDIVRPHR
jgi:hypothetical protein